MSRRSKSPKLAIQKAETHTCACQCQSNHEYNEGRIATTRVCRKGGAGVAPLSLRRPIEGQTQTPRYDHRLCTGRHLEGP
jgi:hypothetical protein